jgi:hypothetical protein
MGCVVLQDASVVPQPSHAHPRSSSLWSAILRRMRRMILPDRVLGSPAPRHVQIFVRNGTAPRCKVVTIDAPLTPSSTSNQQDATAHLAPSG